MPRIEESVLDSSTDAAVSSETGRAEAARYVREEAPRLHEAFSVAVQLDDQRAQINLSRYKRHDTLRTHTDQFYRVVDLYRQNVARNNVLPPDFDIRGRHSWDEVFRAAKDAADYSKGFKGPKGWVKRIGYDAGNAIPYIQPMLEVLPDGDYTGALCGGLRIAFEVAAKRREKKEAILAAFQRIPETIEKAEHCRERHPDNDKIYDLTSDLYLAVLDAITSMIKWLVGDSFWRKNWISLSACFTERPIDVGLGEVQDLTTKLEYQAERLQSDATVETNAVVKKTQDEITRANTVIYETRTETKDIKETTAAILSRLNEQEKQKAASKAAEGAIVFLQEKVRTARWKSRREKLKEEQRRISEEKKKLHEKDKEEQRLISEERKKIHEHEILLQEKEAQIGQAEAHLLRHREQLLKMRQAILTPDRLFELLDVPAEMTSQDLERLTAQGRSWPSSLYAEGHWLLRNKRFQAWLHSEETGRLLVNQNHTSSESNSSMSFACTTLIEALNETREATITSFFSNLHAKGETSVEGPTGLLRSLISQLLLLQSYNLDFVDDRNLEDLSHHDIDFLCNLFAMLVQQLPEETVLFCIVDGISTFEKSKYGDSVALFLAMLSELTETLAVSPRSPIFKVLVTTSKSSKSLKSCFKSQDTIVVPPEASAGRDISGSYLLKHATKMLESPQGALSQASRHRSLGSMEENGEAEDLLADIPSDSGDEM